MPFCPNCGKNNDDRAMYCQACGAVLKQDAGAAPGAAPAAGPVLTPTIETYGGFWKRAGAWVIDQVIVSVATGLIVAASVGVAFPIAIFGSWLYEAFMTSSTWQATLGKRVFNMVVTGTNGQRISFARATGRYFAKWISTLLLGIGFIMAAFTEKKRALHDMIAETLVVNR